jgi:hypothetical protein
MRKIYLASLLSLFVSGCVNAPYINQIDLNKTDFSKIENMKVGRACNAVALFFIPVETEKSILKAVSKANIAKIHYIESRIRGLYPIYYENCVYVYGE